MSHWMDTGRFDDDSDIERPPWQPLSLIVAQLESRFTPLDQWVARSACRDSNPVLFDGPPSPDEPRCSTEECPCPDHGGYLDTSTCRKVRDHSDKKLRCDCVDHMQPSWTPKSSAKRQRTAASTCAACPVRAECLADARDNKATVATIRGGVLFASGSWNGRERVEHNLIDLMHRGLLSDSPAGRGRPAASSAA